jgi:hypothetical protein
MKCLKSVSMTSGPAKRGVSPRALVAYPSATTWDTCTWHRARLGAALHWRGGEWWMENNSDKRIAWDSPAARACGVRKSGILGPRVL